MKNRRNNLLLSAMLWLSIFLVDTLTACAYAHDGRTPTPPELPDQVICQEVVEETVETVIETGIR